MVDAVAELPIMNYFAHALPFLDDPYLAAGTGVPDWLSVVRLPQPRCTR